MEIIIVFDGIKYVRGSYWTHPISTGHMQWKSFLSSSGLTLKTHTAPPREPFFFRAVFARSNQKQLTFVLNLKLWIKYIQVNWSHKPCDKTLPELSWVEKTTRNDNTEIEGQSYGSGGNMWRHYLESLLFRRTVVIFSHQTYSFFQLFIYLVFFSFKYWINLLKKIMFYRCAVPLYKGDYKNESKVHSLFLFRKIEYYLIFGRVQSKGWILHLINLARWIFFVLKNK